MTEQVVIRCHCGQFTETVRLRDQIPIEGLVCHCNICRHVTGAVTFSGIALASPPVEAFQEKLVKYATSEKIWRYFCETCGSHVGYYVTKQDSWCVCPGNIDELLGPSRGKGLLEKYTGHEFVADTIDGGLARCIPDIPFYMEDDGGPAVKDLEQELGKVRQASNQAQDQGKLEVACHCGEVRFSLGRPDKNAEKTRWQAEICACRSCRLSTGQAVSAWAKDIPFSKITWSHGSIHDGQPHGSLRRFESSTGVSRDFCGSCGASIFYHSKDLGDIVDIPVGVLRAEEGTLAKSWLEWLTRPIHFMGDALDQGLVKILQENISKLEE